MGFSLWQRPRFCKVGLVYHILPSIVWISLIWLGTANAYTTLFVMAILVVLSLGATFRVVHRMQTFSTNIGFWGHSFAFNPDRWIRCTVICEILLWYLTMLLPVNIENKLTLFESLFYHGVLVVNLLLLFEVRDSDKSATSLSGSQRSDIKGVDQHLPLSDYCFVDEHQSFVDRFHQTNNRYSVILDCLIMPHNHRRYVLWLLGHLFFIYYTTNLALTSVCTPVLLLNWFIVPLDCSSVYEDFGRSWAFVAALYGLIGSVIFLGLLCYEVLHFVNSLRSAPRPLIGRSHGIWIS